ncbi:hypothetical protein [Deltalipothrixvirus pozzuoliense]|uniref:Uncharacterized protein ORF425 n=1 Tax=Acidianus filamentous virus 2 (isolate Italy/Pozzuoli) TaxID=654910 RepID=Y425_AFV2P|nr:protease [Acidianus filamentous virus 2]Q573F4.1 RecName: Full=Uncharacterized protein ORF425 [Acidianus filamentous virus 2 (isolate Pozzuoli)]CAH69402.1 hypothetical protein [Acidianus filamentous virus 2]
MTSLQEYMVPIVVDGEVPPEIYVALRGTDKDKVKRMWTNANNPFALAKACSRGSAEIVGKPSSVYLKQYRSATYYVLQYPSGKLLLPVDEVDESVVDDIQNELLYVSVVRKNNLYFVTDIEPLVTKSKVERGEELREVADANGVSPDDLPALGYGYVTTSSSKIFTGTDKMIRNDAVNRLSLLMLLRFFTTAKVGGMPVHAFELTTPNTGKTTFAVRNIYLVNWGYIDEAPSFARLVMDAKTSALGLVFRNDGVFIDEIDKYGSNMRDVIHIMLTGMSHGVWKRAKGDTDAPSIVRRIPVYFAGNKDSSTLGTMSTRNYIKNVLVSMKLYQSLVDALLDRIAITIANEAEINASDYVSGYVIADTYLRGYISYVSSQATKMYKDLGIGNGRERQNINAINALCVATTNFDHCDEFAKSVSSGFLV